MALWRWKFSTVLFLGMQEKNHVCSLVCCSFHSRLTFNRKTKIDSKTKK